MVKDDIDAAVEIRAKAAEHSPRSLRKLLAKLVDSINWLPGLLLSLLALIWAVKSFWQAEEAKKPSMMESCRDHPVCDLRIGW